MVMVSVASLIMRKRKFSESIGTYINKKNGRHIGNSQI